MMLIAWMLGLRVSSKRPGIKPLFPQSPSVCLSGPLPLKVLVWEAADGTVWIGYNRPEYLMERHGVPTELLANVRAVETLAAIAAGTA